jgi:hypothetical protein
MARPQYERALDILSGFKRLGCEGGIAAHGAHETARRLPTATHRYQKHFNKKAANRGSPYVANGPLTERLRTSTSSPLCSR